MTLSPLGWLLWDGLIAQVTFEGVEIVLANEVARFLQKLMAAVIIIGD